MREHAAFNRWPCAASDPNRPRLDSQISRHPRRARALEREDRDGELCGVDETGLPSFAQIQPATDGERNLDLVYHAFDLLHLNGRDISALPLIERKALLEPLLANKPVDPC
jgi:ATP-dependent DNA ligase